MCIESDAMCIEPAAPYGVWGGIRAACAKQASVDGMQAGALTLTPTLTLTLILTVDGMQAGGASVAGGSGLGASDLL